MDNKFTILDFNNKYPTEEACIQELFEKKFSHLTECPTCKNPFKYYKVTARKCYACQYCSNQIHPLANTIFHKSDTSIRLWFFAIFLFSASKNGVSAKELQRQLGVTYKTAWRIANKVRTLFVDDTTLLKNIVEADETYVGGVGGNNKRGRGAENKTPVIGAVERKGNIKVKVVTDTKSSTIMPFLRSSVEIKAEMMTDQYRSYKYLPKLGYSHRTVNHGAKEYVRGDVHTNTIEGFWSQLKRSVNGTYHFVSPKYLQNYVNEFSWRYNNRKTPIIFDLLLNRVTNLNSFPAKI